METYGKCPQCGKGGLILASPGYLCNYCKSIDETCKFIIFRQYFGKEITPKIVKDLLSKGKTEVFSDLRKKDGGTFSASLMLEDLKVKPCFETACLDDVSCPKCGSKIMETGSAFACADYHSEERCMVYLSRKIAGTAIGKNDAVTMLSGEKTGFLQFTSASGKNFSARLFLDSEFKVAFDRIICKCPKCSGDIYGGDRAYGCSNYKAADKCTFTVWREIYGKTVTPDIVSELCLNGETGVMKGFKNRQGDPVERKLFLSPEFQVMII
jgi:ssDNA-binding Zn-finger/Zn-ribbon topoisomerase 1